MSSMFDDTYAFEPFFDEPVVVTGKRGARAVCATVSACVIDGGFSDGMGADAAAAPSERVYTVRIRRMDWVELSPPRRGDSVQREDGARLAVAGVEIDGGEFILHTCSRRVESC